MIVPGPPANRCKAALERFIVPLTYCVMFGDTVKRQTATVPLLYKPTASLAGLPANRSKADLREIIVPVPTCVAFEDTMASQEAVGPAPMVRKMSATMSKSIILFGTYKISATAKFRNAVS